MLAPGYYNRECVEALKQFPDKFFDIAVVDPPYGRGEDSGVNRTSIKKRKDGTKVVIKSGNYRKGNWDKKPPGIEYFNELFRVSKNQIIFGCNYFNIPLAGGRIIWDKCNDGSDQSGAEIAYNSLNSRVDIFRYMWRGMLQGKSMDAGTIQQGNKKKNEKRIHQTQKPVNLYRWIVREYVKPGWKVLDTHVGSASSLIAYEEAKLEFWGFEIDKYMYDLSLKRFKEETTQISIFDILGGSQGTEHGNCGQSIL